MNRLSRKIFRGKVKELGVEIALDFVTYLGSATTILSIYFNKRKFDPKNILDDTIILFSLFILVMWILRVKEITKKINKIRLNRKDFFEFVSNEKRKALNSIISISGDVSWLIEEKDSFQSLIKERQNLNIEIFYDKNKINNKALFNLLAEYKKIGIKTLPYPFPNIPHLKALIIDDDTEDVKLFAFIKDDDNFQVDIYKRGDITLNYASAFISNIRSYYEQVNLESKKLFIGISGINNIGKTTLASILKHHYGSDMTIIPDTYKKYNDKVFVTDIIILYEQIMIFLDELKYSSAKILIFDRTPIDNLAFLTHNLKDDLNYKEAVENINSKVMEFAKCLEFVILLKPNKQEFKYKPTKYINIKNRKLVHEKICSLYNESHVKAHSFYISSDEENYKSKLKEISIEVINIIDKKLDL